MNAPARVKFRLCEDYQLDIFRGDLSVSIRAVAAIQNRLQLPALTLEAAGYLCVDFLGLGHQGAIGRTKFGREFSHSG
jgi:hypothetical protein